MKDAIIHPPNTYHFMKIMAYFYIKSGGHTHHVYMRNFFALYPINFWQKHPMDWSMTVYILSSANAYIQCLYDLEKSFSHQFFLVRVYGAFALATDFCIIATSLIEKGHQHLMNSIHWIKMKMMMYNSIDTNTLSCVYVHIRVCTLCINLSKHKIIKRVYN